MSAPDDAESDTALDPEVADYLAAFRAEEMPTPKSVEANWRAIAAQTRPARGIWVGVGLAAAAAIVLVVWGPWRGRSAEAAGDDAGQLAPYEREGKTERTTAQAPEAEPPSPASSPETNAAADDATVEPVPSPDDTDAEADTSAAGEPTPDPAHRSPARARTPRDRTNLEPPPLEPAPPSTLSQETKLLREIKAALDRHEPAEALALAEDHARRFPAGAFANERQVAQARALCALGRKDSARKVADRFVAAHPTSHLVDQMAAICRGTSNDDSAEN